MPCDVYTARGTLVFARSMYLLVRSPVVTASRRLRAAGTAPGSRRKKQMAWTKCCWRCLPLLSKCQRIRPDRSDSSVLDHARVVEAESNMSPSRVEDIAFCAEKASTVLHNELLLIITCCSSHTRACLGVEYLGVNWTFGTVAGFVFPKTSGMFTVLRTFSCFPRSSQSRLSVVSVDTRDKSCWISPCNV